MCNVSCIVFGATHLSKGEVEGKAVLELGACDVNGSLRPIVESWSPSRYIGIDIEAGPGTDVICSAEEMVERFGRESFDIVISTEVVEHIEDWKRAISNIKNVCVPNGIILLTTRSRGFPYHAYPHDFWRYELEDLKHIFSDCEIETLRLDPIRPGVFLRARKPTEFRDADLTGYKLYSIIANRRVSSVDKQTLDRFHSRYLRRERTRRWLRRAARFMFRI